MDKESLCDLREESLENIDDEAVNLWKDSETYAYFANDTAELGLDLRYDLRGKLSWLEKSREEEVLRFLGNELVEEARRTAFKKFNRDELDALDAPLLNSESEVERFYDALFRVDRRQMGYVDLDIQEEGSYDIKRRFPNPISITEEDKEYHLMSAEEPEAVDIEGYGELYLDNIFRIQDDWIQHRRSKKPKVDRIDEIAYNEILSLGIGR